MRNIQKEYINLLKDSIRSKDEIINELLRVNRDMIQETRNLIYEFRRLIDLKSQKEVEKND